MQALSIHHSELFANADAVRISDWVAIASDSEKERDGKLAFISHNEFVPRSVAVTETKTVEVAECWHWQPLCHTYVLHYSI